MIDFSNVTDMMLGNTPVEQVSDSQGNVLWSAAPAPEYFYVEDVSGADNTLSILGHSVTAPAIEVFKSTDGTNWSSMGTTSTTAITATIPANSKLYLKATATNWATDRDDRYNSFSTTGNANIGGYLSSLFVGDNFESDNTTKGRMQCLCQGWTTLISAGDLIMPVDVTGYSFENMFKGCTNLTTAPALPATTLANSCYRGMFQGCTSLTTAPALPAITIFNYNYAEMFLGCTSLTTAPALPATTLAYGCYDSMFKGCTSLTTAPALPATTLDIYCYSSMFRNCTSLTTAPALPATTLVDNCYYWMFFGCTSLTTAPTLPATTLVNGCYQGMFRSCTNLNSVTTYATDISASNCLDSWLYKVSAQGDFYNLANPAPTYPSGTSGIPTGWTEHNSL